MKKLIKILPMLLVIYLSSCNITDLSTNILSWYTPEILKTYPYYPDTNSSYVTYIDTNSISIPDTIYLNYNSTISFKVKVEKVGTYTGYNPYILINVLLKYPLETETLIYSQDILLEEGEKIITLTINLPSSDYMSGNAKLKLGISPYRYYWYYSEGSKKQDYIQLTNFESYTFEKDVNIKFAKSYYVATIPLSNQTNIPDTVIYLYRKEGNSLVKVGWDDNSGYSSTMSKIYRDLAPGQYYIRVYSHTQTSNDFATYVGENYLETNNDTTFVSMTNFSIDSSFTIQLGIPTNSFISNKIDRYFTFYIPE